MHVCPEEIIRAELSAGEELLWAGRPRQGFVLRYYYALCIPFGLLGTGALSFSLVKEINQFMILGASLSILVSQLMGLLCVICILVAPLLLFIGGVGGFALDIRRRRMTYYGVTSERIVIVSVLPKEVKALRLAMLTNVWLSARDNGSGVISFGPVPAGKRWDESDLEVVPNFELPSGALQVYELIRAAGLAAKQRADNQDGCQNNDIMIQPNTVHDPFGP